jgi:hypothetical protein
MYADDLILMSDHSDIKTCEENLQDDINMLSKWCHDMGLIVNIKKTKIMYVANPYLRLNYVSNIILHDNLCIHAAVNGNCACSKLELVDSYEYLGVIIDKNFKFDIHMNKLIGKLRYNMKIIYDLKRVLNEKSIRDVYYAFTHSILLYGILSWGFGKSAVYTKLKKLHLRIPIESYEIWN